ncbi:ExbD/TolR family protein [Capnocytophaga canimorsus]|uniref:ExbD/TolR family protein n=1 Tax=Capnocytophaga canimorsus TaxID=28188 RepID=UPI000C242628|nr:biopolymer transporter ExbD [Capnocytophaga canimorsus]PJI76084.1 biopolymer transport protein ExbD [Capnocytophaga canimorsus]
MAKRSIPEVNAGSMADIAFFLLIFFLVTTTIETNAGIMTKLPPKIDLKTPPPPVKERNVLEVVVNKNNQLLVDGQLMELKDVRKAAKEFLDNGADGSCAHCQGKKLVESSENPDKAVISLRNDRETSYKTYVAVQNELIAAYNELRERERVRLFPNEVSFMEMDAEYNAARTPKSRKNELEPKIKKLQELFPRKLIEAESKKN